MVVYVEELFINNLALLIFTLYISGVVCKAATSYIKINISSCLGAAVYVAALYLNEWGYPLLILQPFICVALAYRFCRAKDYLTTTFVFVMIYFALIGSSACLSYLYGTKAVNILYFCGSIPFLISISFIIITVLVLYIKKRLLVLNTFRNNILRAEVVNANFGCRTNAYYDTGNMVCAENGERVVIVSAELYNKLMPAPVVNVRVGTIGGEYDMPATPILIKIYFEDGANKIYKVMAGKGKIETDRYKIILHRDMR